MNEDSMQATLLSEPEEIILPGIDITDEVQAALDQNSPVAIGVSGGKDSTIAAHQTVTALRKLGYGGEIVLIHADLGSVEWKSSLPICQQVADQLGVELVVVRREVGDLMERWQTRWQNNVNRYINLECVKLILPWSTPDMRFCTSELKTQIICRYLKKRFPGQTILNVTGVRGQESPDRAKKPVSKEQPALTSLSKGTRGIEWNSVFSWKLDQVWEAHKRFSLPIHEAYTVYRSSRVSCAFCMMAKQADLLASSNCPDNQDIYREMVDLEISSSFGFQSAHWLADTAPHLLTQAQRQGVALAKQKAAEREALERQIPKHLLYSKGWPTIRPSREEAGLLADIRRKVGALLDLPVLYTTADEVLARYDELLAIAETKRPRSEPVAQECTPSAGLQLSLF